MKRALILALALIPGPGMAERAYEDYDQYQGLFYQRLASQCIQRAGTAPQCTDLLEISLQFISDSSEVHLVLGKHYAAAGDLQRSTNSLVRALELDPNLSLARTALGDVYLAQDKAEMAREQYGKFIQDYPSEALGYYLLATSYAVELKEEKALQQLKIAVDKGFFEPEALRADPRWRNVIGSEKLEALLEGLGE